MTRERALLPPAVAPTSETLIAAQISSSGKESGLLEPGERVVFTSGERMETHGATNTLRLLQVGKDGKAEGLGEL